MPLSKSGRRNWLIPALIVLAAAVLVAFSVLMHGGAESDPARSGARVSSSEGAPLPIIDRARLAEGDPLALGPVDAPVTLIVYSDFQCPFCAMWSADTGPEMRALAQRGDLRIEYRDIAGYGEDSERAARAAYAAGLQGRYLDFHEALFEDSQKRPPGELTPEALVKTAERLDLDIEKFRADFQSWEVTRGVQRNIDEAAEVGAFSTPSFLLAGRPILGAQSTEVFTAAITAVLEESKDLS